MNTTNWVKPRIGMLAVIAAIAVWACLGGLTPAPDPIADLNVNIAPLSVTPDVVSVGKNVAITVSASVGALPTGLVLEFPGETPCWTFNLVKVQYRTLTPTSGFTTWDDWNWSTDSGAIDVTSNSTYYTDDLVSNGGHSGIKHFNFTPLQPGYWHLTVQAIAKEKLRNVSTGVVADHTNLGNPDTEQTSSNTGLTLTAVELKIKYKGLDVTNMAQAISVGQSVALTAAVLPNDLTTAYRWVIDGSVLKDYAYSNSTATATNLSPTDLAQKSIAFYWLPPGSTADATFYVLGTACSAKTTFNVWAPTDATLTASYEGAVAVSKDDYAPGTWLHFGGTVVGSSYVPGIQFSCNATIPVEYALTGPTDALSFVQQVVVKLEFRQHLGILRGFKWYKSNVPDGALCLDTSAPYPKDPLGTNETNDEPGARLRPTLPGLPGWTKECRYTASFFMILWYTPHAPLGGTAIPVSLKSAHWGFSGWTRNGAFYGWTTTSSLDPTLPLVADDTVPAQWIYNAHDFIGTYVPE